MHYDFFCVIKAAQSLQSPVFNGVQDIWQNKLVPANQAKSICSWPKNNVLKNLVYKLKYGLNKSYKKKSKKKLPNRMNKWPPNPENQIFCI